MSLPDGVAILTIDNLGDLANGGARAAINAALRAAMKDTEDRGLEDEKVRVVTIQVEMEKVSDDDVSIVVKAVFKPPHYQLQPTFALIKRDGDEVEMAFRPHSADNPQQQTIPFAPPVKTGG